jgi:hypothetical protein
MSGGPFGDVLQLGRQSLNVTPEEYPRADAILAKTGVGVSLMKLTDGSTSWADQGLLQGLGATSIRSADASAYEGAEIVHDFNQPIGLEWHDRFDTVIDAGTLEHIFNIPVALANLMQMVKVGGRIISMNGANNWLGHGFYQFSPELPYRVFVPNNGFEITALYLIDPESPDILVPAQDSEAVGRRVEYGRTGPVFYLMFCARKIALRKPFEVAPQQSDYSIAWDRHASAK